MKTPETDIYIAICGNGHGAREATCKFKQSHPSEDLATTALLDHIKRKHPQGPHGYVVPKGYEDVIHHPTGNW